MSYLGTAIGMSVVKHVFSTAKFDVGEYTYVKKVEFNEMVMELNRAHEAEARLADEVDELKARLGVADKHYDELAEQWAELRRKFRQRNEQYEELWSNWTALCEQWATLKTQYNKCRTELAARNSPATTQGTHTISNESRPQYITRPALCSRCATRR